MAGIFTYIIIFGSVLLVLGGGAIWYLNRMSWNYTFHLITNSGIKPVQGKKITSKTNKSQRFFIFKHNGTKLHIKEPNGSYNNKPTRYITYSPNGDYVYVNAKGIVSDVLSGEDYEKLTVEQKKLYKKNAQDYHYIEGFKADKEQYLKYSLEPEERELSLWRFQENQKSYGAVDKMQVATLFASIAIVVVISIAIIYSVISFTNNADTFGEIAKNNRETVSEMRGQVSAIMKISEYQLLIMQQLNSDFDGGDIVRTLN